MLVPRASLRYRLRLKRAASPTAININAGGAGIADDESPQFPEPGEITGSVSISSAGEIWLTTFVDTYSILSHIEVVVHENGNHAYKFSIAGIGLMSALNEEAPSPDFNPEHAVIFCEKEDEAIEKLTNLAERVGLQLTELSMRSIPIAIGCGWKNPEERQKFIENLLNEHRDR